MFRWCCVIVTFLIKRKGCPTPDYGIIAWGFRETRRMKYEFIEITRGFITSLLFFCNEENYDYFYTIVGETMYLNINH